MDWNHWLYEEITFDGLVTCPRWKAIKSFVKDGLIPFFSSYGYTFAAKEQELCSRIATGLFVNASKSCLESDWKFEHVNIGSTEYQRLHYYHTIDSDAWEAFWSIWGTWYDVGELSERGSDRRYDIQEYCWTQLSAHCSPQMQMLEDTLRACEDGGKQQPAISSSYTTSNYGKVDDVYLRDMNEYSY